MTKIGRIIIQMQKETVENLESFVKSYAKFAIIASIFGLPIIAIASLAKSMDIYDFYQDILGIDKAETVTEHILAFYLTIMDSFLDQI